MLLYELDLCHPPPGGSDAVAAGEGLFERGEFVTCLQVQKTLVWPPKS